MPVICLLQVWPAFWVLLPRLVRQGIDRDRHTPLGWSLGAACLRRMEPYFRAADLERVRVRQIQPERVPNPGFSAYCGQATLRVCRSLQVWPRLRSIDVIVFQETPSAELVLHELVHTVQFRILGVEAFARSYVRGF